LRAIAKGESPWGDVQIASNFPACVKHAMRVFFFACLFSFVLRSERKRLLAELSDATSFQRVCDHERQSRSSDQGQNLFRSRALAFQLILLGTMERHTEPDFGVSLCHFSQIQSVGDRSN
jgi:hypothetical protein